MQCDEEIEEKRPYIQPQDLIYAQPVHLKPVGRPIAAVPIKGPSSAGYGPPKPVPFPPSPSYGGGPPLPPRPYFPGNKPPLGPLYGASRPPAVYEPLIDNIDKKQVLVSPNQGVQQHVHHHYHHNTDSEKVGVLDAPGPVYPSATGGVGPVYSGEVNSLYSNSVGGNGFVGSPTYGGGFDSYAGSSSSFYKKELNLKGSTSSKALFCCPIFFF